METFRELLKYFKDHVWGTVIGGVLVLVFGAIFVPEKIKQYLLVAWECISDVFAGIWNWISSTHEVYGWVLTALILLALTAVALLTLKAIKTYKIVKREREKPDYLSYTNEHFYGVTWEWMWEETSKGQYQPGTPIARCIECQSILDINRRLYLEIECINDNCSWKWDGNRHSHPGKTRIYYYDFEKKLKTEILRKITAGEYRTTH